MKLRQLAKSEWPLFCGTLEPLLRVKVVEVEATGLGLPDQLAREWVRLAEFSYDSAGDVLQIAVHGGERSIAHPAAIQLREDDDGWLHSIEVVRRDGGRDFVILREALAIPA